MDKAVHPKWTGRRRPWWRSLLAARLTLVLALLGITSVAYVATGDKHQLPRVHSSGGSSSKVVFRKEGCDIKGNIDSAASISITCPAKRIWLPA
jgi:hypothetical protein